MFKTHRSNSSVCNELARSVVGISDQVKGRKFCCNFELCICDKLAHSNALSRRLVLKEQTIAPKMKPPRSKLRGIRRKGIGDETTRFLMLFPLYGNP